MTWPEIGKPLPRVRDAYAPPAKWDWILGDEGHGPHWRRVFGDVEPGVLWDAFVAGALTEPVSRVRNLGELGRTSEVSIQLVLTDRAATVITAWHYDHVDAAPRLVSAYPTT